MKNIRLYFIIAGFVGFTSCVNDILDKKPLDIISEEVVWNDPDLVDSYMARQYASMHIFRYDAPDDATSGGGSSIWNNRNAHMYVTNISDEAGRPVWAAADPASYKRGGMSISGGLLEWWPYTIIRQLNMLIEKLPESANDPDFIAGRVAEARFLRAFNYFAMIKRYGGVHLITKVIPLDAPDEELYPVRNSEQEIYDFVISEIDAVEETLKSFTEYGRASQGAALALKCRAALYAGSIAQFGTVQLDGLLGIPQAQAPDYYRKSYDAAKKIINGGKFALYNSDEDKVTNFKNVFLKERNSEMIFVKQHDGSQIYWFYGFMICPKPHGYDMGMSVAPYLEMAEEFEYTDGSPGTLDRDAIQQGLWSMEELWGDKDSRFHASIYPRPGRNVSEKVLVIPGQLLIRQYVHKEQTFDKLSDGNLLNFQHKINS
ncbi:MAG: RagB/SusD family nutrient uptake outer membrane protein [Tannerella sp.]|nr:RagB/SusD family nutrient uptake outer membrane protein [Tannerella sp.]